MPNDPFSVASPRKIWIDHVPMSLRGLVLAVVFGYILEAIDFILPGQPLDAFGIRPRQLLGLIGIPLMPFLHGGFGHLISNTIPFFILGWIVLKAEKENFIVATTVIILLGGIGTWIIGSPGLHIGASGLIYGYFGYVMTRAILERKPLWILIGVIVGVFFGGMIFGVVPVFAPNQISWEGHLCGMLAGAWFGWNRTKEAKLLATNI